MWKVVTYYSSTHLLMQMAKIQSMRASLTPPSDRLSFVSLERETSLEGSFCSIHDLLKCVYLTALGG